MCEFLKNLSKKHPLYPKIEPFIEGQAAYTDRNTAQMTLNGKVLLDDPFFEFTIMHELIHVLDALNNKKAKETADRVFKEKTESTRSQIKKLMKDYEKIKQEIEDNSKALDKLPKHERDKKTNELKQKSKELKQKILDTDEILSVLYAKKVLESRKILIKDECEAYSFIIIENTDLIPLNKQDGEKYFQDYVYLLLKVLQKNYQESKKAREFLIGRNSLERRFLEDPICKCLEKLNHFLQKNPQYSKILSQKKIEILKIRGNIPEIIKLLKDIFCAE